ncbi:hypothetical protein [Burkholderia anthina]|uniref:hypothetical protein n=1 Tax=Burkholderia anthina TaxID=179879 RepID=UPI0015898E73|nr:hypothetical protein [Burkholderia anthina]
MLSLMVMRRWRSARGKPSYSLSGQAYVGADVFRENQKFALDQGWEEMLMEEQDVESWRKLKGAFSAYIGLRQEFLKKESAANFILDAFSVPEERSIAVSLVASYPVTERLIFFKQLISLASYVNGLTEDCRRLILELPRDWVMSRIESEVGQMLANANYEEYCCLLELCYGLNRDLMIKFAKQAQGSEDEDIKEAGADFLSR